MPNKIIKDGQIISDNWTIVTSTEEQVLADNIIVSLDIWQQQKATLAGRHIGLYLENDQEVSEIADELSQLALIAINFPVFMDGRGFSIARILRERYGYAGELRATGGIIRDQLCYLKRCGFNAFAMADDIDLDAALASLNDFTESYQMSIEPNTPLFFRRSHS